MKLNRFLFTVFALTLALIIGETTSVSFLPISSHGNYVHAEIQEPDKRDQNITILVTRLLRHEHISKRPIDQEIAERTISNLLKALDPQKLYFYDSDVKIFEAQKKNLPGWFEEGHIQFAYVVFKTYLARMDKRTEVMLELLKEPIDFTVNEEMVTDRDLLTYPKTEAEARERLRKRVKYDLLLLQMDDLLDQKKKDNQKDAEKDAVQASDKPAETQSAEDTQNAEDSQESDAAVSAKEEEEEEEAKTPEQKHKEAIEKLAKRYTSLQKRMHQISDDDLLEIYLTSMTSSFDPHTSYMSPSTLENFEIAMRLELDGIGASLQSEDGYVVVRHLVPGGAADKEGSLKIDDKICGVGQGVDGPIEDIVDMKLDDVVKKVRGKQGTIVRLEVIPASGGAKKIVQITRAKIELKDSEANGTIFDAGKKEDGTPYKIGVINLPSFYMDMQGARNGSDYKSTTRDVQKILDNFKKNHVDAVVLDLRNNGGGSLQEAISLTGLFIRTGTVVQVKDAYGNVMPYNDTDPGIAWAGPLVVVINKFSASASEILAGAIQDYNRGIIIGDKTTHGKGTVQTLDDIGRKLIPLPNAIKLGALKVTMQQFYRPLGDSTQFRGVESDIEIPAITTHMDVGEGDLDYAMPFDRIPAQKIDDYGLMNTNAVKALSENSQKRIAESEDFQKLSKRIDIYCEMKERKSVTLNAEKFLAERSGMIDEEEKKLEERIVRSANEITRDYYMDEILNITQDYMRAFRK
ncbi:MAG: carboxy terminal-processing peptidase [Planctomycetia bacterium]|nr:carboxy terminal-processing peptidase [Planctomycetia bacterium]